MKLSFYLQNKSNAIAIETLRWGRGQINVYRHAKITYFDVIVLNSLFLQ